MNTLTPRLIAATLATLALLWPSCVPDQVMIERNGAPVCGDGEIEGSEQCDDGNTTDGDGCSATCQTEAGVEIACDDGVDNDLDGLVDCADSDCANAAVCTDVCGDGVVGASEQCDDGNTTNGDGCDARCMLETAVEDCRDGVDNDSDGLVDCADPDCAGAPGCP